MKKLPRIDQLLPTYTHRDAIGTEVQHIEKLLTNRGIENAVFTQNWHPSLEGKCCHVQDYSRFSKIKNAISIYHHSIGCPVPFYTYQAEAFNVTHYHNITPPRFFAKDTDYQLYFETTKLGFVVHPVMRLFTHFTWADSYFNAQEFVDYGFKEPLVLPLLRDYRKLVDLPEKKELALRLKDGRKNILFTGRFAPNKAQHDLLFLLKLLHEYVDPKIRLVLVGSRDMIKYPSQFLDLAKSLNLSVDMSPESDRYHNCDVLAPGSVDDSSMTTYYRNADLFLCLSDHEGFCVPLVESMFFGLPIIAHTSTAVPETLGDGGLLIDKYDWPGTVATIKAVLSDVHLSSSLREKAKKRAEHFAWPALEKQFDVCLDQTLKAFFEHQNT